ncbi:hypothetical protein SSS_00840 [Sarcoptes scabiei]|uniref:Resistance to inhibitors of cholinesterase protein 3 N-terminal domain-containing protein n=1 Tax=Sarcoptes scabiei TaxID=52283 RepID=A0A834VEQ3_SARSC|nr:hypothetical protein SSS_00840 [Sarcoptes scabiei]
MSQVGGCGNASGGLSNFKSICIIIVVIGCFSVLWPKIFYPMLLYGLWDSNQKDQQSQFMPARLREVINQSPNLNQQKSNVQRLPGRPQFYTGKRQDPNATNQPNSTWNIIVPLYTFVLALIFLYAFFKITLKSADRKSDPNQFSNQKLHPPEGNCRECQYDQMRRLYTNRKYDPYLSRGTYRTFDYYGRKNVSLILRSLVKDVQIFRDQLIKAELCQCKLNSYDEEIENINDYLEEIDKQEISDQNEKDDDDLIAKQLNETNLEKKSNSSETYKNQERDDTKIIEIEISPPKLAEEDLNQNVVDLTVKNLDEANAETSVVLDKDDLDLEASDGLEQNNQVVANEQNSTKFTDKTDRIDLNQSKLKKRIMSRFLMNKRIFVKKFLISRISSNDRNYFGSKWNLSNKLNRFKLERFTQSIRKE